MTLEEIKYFSDQFTNLRNELKQDLKELQKHIDKTLGGHASQLDDHEDRLVQVENFHWRTTAILGVIVFITQIVVNIALEIIRK